MRLQGNIIPDRPMDLTEWAYNTLKRQILDNNLPAGSQIVVDQVAAQLNISRTPVREALLLLQNKGIVHIIPRVGCFVCEITRDELREVFELRCVIESYAARKAAENMSDEELQHWLEQVRKSVAAYHNGDLMEFNSMETIIHDLLIQRLNNKRILNVMEMVADNIYRERVIGTKSAENVKHAVEEHRAIVDAIVGRRADDACTLMEIHIRNVERRIEKIVFDAE